MHSIQLDLWTLFPHDKHKNVSLPGLKFFRFFITKSTILEWDWSLHTMAPRSCPLTLLLCDPRVCAGLLLPPHALLPLPLKRSVRNTSASVCLRNAHTVVPSCTSTFPGFSYLRSTVV